MAAELTANKMAKELLYSLQAAGLDYLPWQGPVPAAATRLPTTADAVAKPVSIPRSPAPVALPTVRVSIPTETSRTELEELRSDAEKCERCPSLSSTRSQVLFGDGPVNPLILFIGEAPNANEDREGKLMTGEVETLFEKMMTACGLTRADYYMTNLLKCRIPGGRAAKPEECTNCRGYLDRQIALLQPNAICCFGEVASQRFLGTSDEIGVLRTNTRNFQGRPVFTTHHPEQVLKNPAEFKRPIWDDLRRMMAELGRPVRS